MWFLGIDSRTNMVVEVPEVSAMTAFESLPDDFSVWCADGNGEAVVIARRHLSRI